MKSKNLLPLRLRKSIFPLREFALLVAVSMTASLHGQTVKTWSGLHGNNSNWGSNANWVGGTAAVGGDTLIFTGSTRLDATNSLSGGTGFAGITFDANAGSFLLSGNGLFLTGNVVNSSSVLQTLGTFTGNGITLNAPTITFNASTANMLVQSKISTNGNQLYATASSGMTLTFNGPIEGAGKIEKRGLGTVVLGGTNNYSGTTTLDRGTLQISSSDNLAGTSGIIFTTTVSDATLHVTADGVNLGKNITQTGQGNYRVDSGNTFTLGGVISGTGVFRKQGDGTVVLAGTNTYTGATQLGSGTLAVSSASNLQGTSGVEFLSGSQAVLFAAANGVNLSKNITQTGQGNYRVDSGNTVTLGGVISGTGVFQKQGLGTVVLAGTNTYTGATELASGTLSISSASNLQGTSGIHFQGGSQTTTLHATANGIALGMNILQDGPGNYRVDAGNTLSLNGVISGFGQFRKDGEGTIILNGANNYSGRTVINSGTLRLGTGSIINTNMDVVGGTFDLNGKNQNISDTLTIGTSSSQGVIVAGTMTVGSSIDARSGSASAILAGLSSLTKSTSGTVTLSGENTYSGGTTISSGVLRLGDGGTTGSIVGNVAVSGSNGALAFNRSNNYTFAQTISGGGRVKQIGSGTTTLSVANSYSGGTDVNAGFLIAGNDDALGTGAVVVSGSGETPATKGTLVLGAGRLLANNFVLSGGEVERTIANGATYNLGTTGTISSSFSSDSYENTVAAILASGVSDGAVLTYSMSANASEAVVNDYLRASDVFHIDLGGDTSAGYFVLHMGLESGVTPGYIGYLNGVTWVNAGSNFLGNIDYNGSITVGDYGYTNSGAWVVLNHNSEYSLLVVPEPSISGLIGFAVFAGGAAQMMRRRYSGQKG